VLRFGTRAVQAGREQDAAAMPGRDGATHHRLRDRDGRPHVEMEDAVEVASLELKKVRLRERTQIIHQHVDSAKRLPRRADEPFHFRIVRQVGLNVRKPGMLAQNRLKLRAIGFAPLRSQHRARPVRCERPADRQADPSTAPRHQSAFSSRHVANSGYEKTPSGRNRNCSRTGPEQRRVTHSLTP